MPKKKQEPLLEPVCRSLQVTFRLVATDLDRLHHRQLYVRNGIVMFKQFIIFHVDPHGIRKKLLDILRRKNPKGAENWLVLRKAPEFGCWGPAEHEPFDTYYYLDELFEDDEKILPFIDMTNMTEADLLRKEDREQDRAVQQLNQQIADQMQLPDLMDFEESRRFIENVRFDGKPVREKPEIEFE